MNDTTDTDQRRASPATSDGRRRECNEFIRTYGQRIRKVCLDACQKHYREVLLDPHGFETFVSFASQYLAAWYVKDSDAGIIDPEQIYQRRLPHLAQEARALMDAAAGGYQRPQVRLFDKPRQLIMDVAPAENQRKALMIVWYHAAGYGPDEPTAAPYQRVEDETGVMPEELDQMLTDLASREPDWFDRQFGAGLIRRVGRRGTPRMSAGDEGVATEIEIPAPSDGTDPEGPYGDELRAAARLLSTGRARSPEAALEQLIGRGSVESFRTHPEWQVVIDRILELSRVLAS